jgi:hypothetical protein
VFFDIIERPEVRQENAAREYDNAWPNGTHLTAYGGGRRIGKLAATFDIKEG